MSYQSEFIHYITIALAVGVTALGVAFGQGITSRSALKAIRRQPEARNDIMKAAIIGVALIETASVIGIFVSIILLMAAKPKPITLYADVSSIGIALAVCATGLVLGIASSLPAQAAFESIARQPFWSKRITSFMIMTQALTQMPIIAGLVVAIFIRNQAIVASSIADALRLIAAGLVIGIGSIGPAIGLAVFAKQACMSIGINPQAYKKLLSFTIISQAVIETPIIFSLVIAMTLLFIVPAQETSLLKGIAYVSAALCTGLGTFGPGISSGMTAASACKTIASNPEQSEVISRLSLVAQSMIETCTVYAIVNSIMLILF